MVTEIRKTEVLMDKPIAVGKAILDISKTFMYEFWYDYVKQAYQDKVKLCYMDTDSFILQIQTNDFFEDINDDVIKWFDTSNYDKNDNRPLEIAKNKKVIGKLTDELGGKVLTEFVALRAKTYAYIQLNEDKLEKHKRAKGTKKCVIKKHFNFDLYKKALFNNKTIRCTQQRFKSDYHNICTQTVHKSSLDNDDGKRIQSHDGRHPYPHGIDKDLVNKLETNQFNYTIKNKQLKSDNTNKSIVSQNLGGLKYSKINKKKQKKNTLVFKKNKYIMKIMNNHLTEYKKLLQTFSLQEQIDEIIARIMLLANKKHIAKINDNKYARIKELKHMRNNILNKVYVSINMILKIKIKYW